jgi:tetratricopeptide (TPR) repeat protein
MRNFAATTPAVFIRLALLVSLALLAACQTTRQAPHPPLPSLIYDGMGNHTRTITTSSDEAQLYFDQGLQLTFGFNHDEAIRSYRRAAELDPSAPMPWWGVAYCLGININDPEMNEQRSRDAWHAVKEARARIGSATPVERALIEALSTRYAWPIPEYRTHLDRAYADAMQRVHEQYPDDVDIAALYAESLMNLQPWDYWTHAGEPNGRILEVVEILERAMRNNPAHPGANHFYIHAVEASQDPDRAVPAADRLTSLVPGSGHLVHMPSHIYVRVGRYTDAKRSNLAAVAIDRAYFAKAPPPGLYAMYYGHNLHFLAFASMMSGNEADAMKAARDLEADIPEEPLRAYASLIDGIMPTTFHVLARFGRWEEILREPDYPEWRLMSRLVRSYARSVACSALGRTKQARVELEEFERRAAEVPADWMVMQNKSSDLVPIARAIATGELLFRESRREEAYAILREGVAMEDRLVYDEPPGWMLPVRHTLGALMMADERYAECEAIYRQDLAQHRENMWGLTGLSLALKAQGKTSEAVDAGSRLEVALADATLRPSSSCLCQP